MRKKTVFVAVGIVTTGIVMLFAAGYLVLRDMDLNAYRPEVIARVKALTGRDLQIAGDLRIGIRNGLVIRAGAMTLSNAEWGSRPEMLTVGYAEARLALLPLFQGGIDIKEVILHDADLLLESDASGSGNWQLGEPARADAGPVFQVPSVSLASGRLTWRLADAAPLVLTDLELELDGGEDAYSLDGRANFDGEAIELSGRLPSPFELRAGQPEPIDLRLQLKSIDISSRGTLQQTSWGLAPELKVSAKAANPNDLRKLTGRPLPLLSPIELTFDLSRSADGWQLSNLVLTVANSAMTGQLQISTGAVRSRLSAALEAKQIDLTELVPLQSAQPPKAKAAHADKPLQWFGLLKKFDAALQLRIERVVTWDLDLLKMQIDGQLVDGHLRLQPVKTNVAGGGRAEGRFELRTGAGQPNWHLALQLRDLPAGALLGPTRASLISAPLDLDLSLKTAGRSTQQAISNLSGDVHLVVGEGRVQMQAIDSLVGGLRTLTGQLLAQGSDDAQLNCAVADFSIKQGVAKAGALLVDSEVSTVRGDGHIDLANGRINLTFTPRAKRATLNVAVPVHVRGPLHEPQFTADRTAVVGKLLGVASVFVYPPAAVVTLGELGGPGNPCIKLMQGEAVDEAPSAVGTIGKGVGGAVKGLGSGFKKILGQ